MHWEPVHHRGRPDQMSEVRGLARGAHVVQEPGPGAGRQPGLQQGAGEAVDVPVRDVPQGPQHQGAAGRQGP